MKFSSRFRFMSGCSIIRVLMFFFVVVTHNESRNGMFICTGPLGEEVADIMASFIKTVGIPAACGIVTSGRQAIALFYYVGQYAVLPYCLAIVLVNPFFGTICRNNYYRNIPIICFRNGWSIIKHSRSRCAY